MGVVNVIGAGPVGLHCAAMLAEEGFAISVFEEHSTIGRPVQCAGLVSRAGIEQLGVKLGNSVVNEVKGVKIFSPGGECITVERNETVAYVIDRFLFDQLFYKKAKRLGCKIRTESMLIDIRNNSLFMQSSGHGELLKSKITVGADGFNSIVRHSVFPGLFGNVPGPVGQCLSQRLAAYHLGDGFQIAVQVFKPGNLFLISHGLRFLCYRFNRYLLRRHAG